MKKGKTPRLFGLAKGTPGESKDLVKNLVAHNRLSRGLDRRAMRGEGTFHTQFRGGTSTRENLQGTPDWDGTGTTKGTESHGE